MEGGDGNDLLEGGAGADTLRGGMGDDRLYIDAADVVDGGAGFDTVVIQGADGVSLDLGAVQVERVFGGIGADRLTAGSGGGVEINGGGGDDWIIGGGLADTLRGDAGVDTVDYSQSFAGVSVSLTSNRGTGGTAEGDRLSGIESLIGSVFADTLIGDTGANRLEGGNGDDAISGGGGDDTFQGGMGNDTMIGGDGLDTVLFQGNADDAVFTQISGGWIIEGPEGADILWGIEEVQFGDRIIYLDGRNNAPEAITDIDTTDNRSIFIINPSDLLKNDTDFDGDILSVISVWNAKNGTVNLDKNGYIVFKPQSSFVGMATFQYEVGDGRGGTATGMVNIDVTPGGDMPAPLTSLIAGSQQNVSAGSLGLTLGKTDVATLPDGGVVAVWYGGNVIHSQRFNANGTALGGNVDVSTTGTANTVVHPSVAVLKDGGWVVTWDHPNENGTYGIVQQRYASSGARIGSETRVNSYDTSRQQYPETTALADGGWLVTWSSSGQDGSGWGIYQQRYNADGIRVDGERQVNTFAEGHQSLSEVAALPDGGWVVTWRSDGQDGSGLGIYQQRYGANGQPIGPEQQVNTFTAGRQADSIAAALSDGGWVVAWESTGQDGSGLGVYGQIYNADGSRRGGEFQINQSVLSEQHQVAVTGTSDGGFVASWASSNGPGGTYNIYAGRFDEDGMRVGNEFKVNQVNSSTVMPYMSYPSISARPDGGFTIVWEGLKPEQSTYHVHMRVFRAASEPPIVGVNAVNISQNQSVGGSYLISKGHSQGDQWSLSGLQQIDRYEIIDNTIGSATGYFSINGIRQEDGKKFAVSSKDIDFLLWNSGSGIGSDNIQVRAFDGQRWSDWKSGNPTTVPSSGSIVAGSQQNVSAGSLGLTLGKTDVATLPDGGVVAVWYGGNVIHSQRFNANGTALGGNVDVSTTGTANTVVHPSVAVLKDGGWVVTWDHPNENGTYGIVQQRYASSGARIGSETRVNSYDTSRQQYPETTALADGGWLVTWSSSGQDGSGWGIYQQRYNADGIRVDGERQVNTFAEGHQSLSEVAALPDGGWVVTWRSDGQDGSGLGIYQQRYGANGQPIGPEQQVNTFTAGRQADSIAAALSDGGWVVAWESTGQDGSGLGVYGQIYNADGSRRGGEFQINQSVLSEQHQVAVTGTSDGGFVASWASSNGPGGTYNIYAGRFDEDGMRVGNEFKVNQVNSSTVMPYMSYPSISARPDGGFTIVWEGLKPEQSTYHVHMRQYPGNTNSPGKFVGGTGSDTLFGSSGTDILTGGGGNDTFLFSHVQVTPDTITDFVSGYDRIALVASSFGGLSIGELPESQFSLEVAKDADDRLIFNTANKTIYYDADGIGSGVPVAIVSLNTSNITARDIHIVGDLA